MNKKTYAETDFLVYNVHVHTVQYMLLARDYIALHTSLLMKLLMRLHFFSKIFHKLSPYLITTTSTVLHQMSTVHHQLVSYNVSGCSNSVSCNHSSLNLSPCTSHRLCSMQHAKMMYMYIRCITDMYIHLFCQLTPSRFQPPKCNFCYYSGT